FQGREREVPGRHRHWPFHYDETICAQFGDKAEHACCQSEDQSYVHGPLVGTVEKMLPGCFRLGSTSVSGVGEASRFHDVFSKSVFRRDAKTNARDGRAPRIGQWRAPRCRRPNIWDTTARVPPDSQGAAASRPPVTVISAAGKPPAYSKV